MLGEFSAGYLPTTWFILQADAPPFTRQTAAWSFWGLDTTNETPAGLGCNIFTHLPFCQAAWPKSAVLVPCTQLKNTKFSALTNWSCQLWPQSSLDLAFCVPAWWCTGETVHGGEGWISERWKQPVSPRAQEEVGPEMWDKELPLLLLSFYQGEKSCSGAKLWKACSGFTLYLHCLQTGNLIGYVERSALLMSLSLLLYKQIYIRLGLK